MIELDYPVSLSKDVAELRRENATLRARLREREEECQRWALRWATDDHPVQEASSATG